jgi:microcystin-dependent protein
MATPFLGEIKLISFNFAPKGWTFCNGQLLPINQNQALFSILGTTYGGNGQTTFALPNLQGRVALGMGQGNGLSTYTIGQQAGAQTATLNASTMAAHTHTAALGTLAIAAVSTAANTRNAANAFPAGEAAGVTATYSTAAPDTSMANVPKGTGSVTGGPTLASTGGSQPFSILQPYLTLGYVIALVGIFPSRN